MSLSYSYTKGKFHSQFQLMSSGKNNPEMHVYNVHFSSIIASAHSFFSTSTILAYERWWFKPDPHPGTQVTTHRQDPLHVCLKCLCGEDIQCYFIQSSVDTAVVMPPLVCIRSDTRYVLWVIGQLSCHIRCWCGGRCCHLQIFLKKLETAKASRTCKARSNWSTEDTKCNVIVDKLTSQTRVVPSPQLPVSNFSSVDVNMFQLLLVTRVSVTVYRYFLLL